MVEENITATLNSVCHSSIIPQDGGFLLTESLINDSMETVADLKQLLEGRIRDAQKRRDEIDAEIADYQRALDQEKRRLGTPSKPDPSEINKTTSLLKFVKENQARGVTHKDMREHLEALGVTVSKNFTYNFVDRFKGTKIEEVEGRIFRKE